MTRLYETEAEMDIDKDLIRADKAREFAADDDAFLILDTGYQPVEL